MSRPRHIVEHGDFQTPEPLAREFLAAALRGGRRYRTILEPTCGRGSILLAAAEALPGARAIGVDLNAAHLADLEEVAKCRGVSVETHRADFFSVDWAEFLARCAAPILLIGNPPWVTNSALGALGSGNLPPKRNTAGVRGIDAITGKSNFDISEWILHALLEAAAGRDAELQFLVKTSTARKLAARIRQHALPYDRLAVRGIDSRRHFGIAASACAFSVRSDRPEGMPSRIEVFDNLTDERPAVSWGWIGDAMVSNMAAAQNASELIAPVPLRWRSGIKHDCAAVLECDIREEGIFNGLGERLEIERELLFPLVKGSELFAGGAALGSEKCLLLPQLRLSDSTLALARSHPRTFAYLEAHREQFALRKSTLYQRGEPFRIFGLGPYTFSPWKVAVSALHREIRFRAVGPVGGRPVVFDDTVYFLPCESEEAAHRIVEVLAHPKVEALLRAFVFQDAKRLVTAELLGRIDLARAERVVFIGKTALLGASVSAPRQNDSETTIDLFAQPRTVR